MRFPLLGLARDLHPVANAHAERTSKKKNRHLGDSFVWTSLGLNQGPPDYELFSLLFHRIQLNTKSLTINILSILIFAEKVVNLHLI